MAGCTTSNDLTKPYCFRSMHHEKAFSEYFFLKMSFTVIDRAKGDDVRELISAFIC